MFCLEIKKQLLSLQHQNKERDFSSVGSEHLPYKQRVNGSNPLSPTKTINFIKAAISGFFYVFKFVRSVINISRKLTF